MSDRPTSHGYAGQVPSRLLVVSDDLLFAARAQAAGTRLGLRVEQITPGDIEARAGSDDVVVLQVTLNSERQLALLQRLRSRKAAPMVVAVAGHLETELRRKAKALGASLASHSGLDRALARAAGISDAGGPPPSHP
jgi:DNA-binding response OmpR family regulator